MKRRVIICVALLLVCTMMSNAALSVKASNVTSESIKQMEAQIKDAKKQKDNLKNNITNLEKIKKELEAEKGNLKNYVAKLDQNVADMEHNITYLQNQITTKETEIAQTRAELEAAQETVAKQYVSMRTRIRFMYEAGSIASVWELLASSDSIGDFLNKADYINSIYAYDQKMWEEYQMNCEYIQLCKEGLELEKFEVSVDEARELVKGKVLEGAMMTPREVCDEICEATGADGVAVIGTKFVIYRFSEKCQEERNQTGRAKRKETPAGKLNPVRKGAKARRAAAQKVRQQRNEYFRQMAIDKAIERERERQLREK